MANTDTRTERRWKYEFNEAGGTWARSVGLRATTAAAPATQRSWRPSFPSCPATNLLCDCGDSRPLQASEGFANSLGKTGAVGLPLPCPRTHSHQSLCHRSGARAARLWSRWPSHWETFLGLSSEHCPPHTSEASTGPRRRPVPPQAAASLLRSRQSPWATEAPRIPGRCSSNSTSGPSEQV